MATAKVANSCLLIGLAEPVLWLGGAYKILGERRWSGWVGVALSSAILMNMPGGKLGSRLLPDAARQQQAITTN